MSAAPFKVIKIHLQAKSICQCSAPPQHLPHLTFNLLKLSPLLASGIIDLCFVPSSSVFSSLNFLSLRIFTSRIKKKYSLRIQIRKLNQAKHLLYVLNSSRGMCCVSNVCTALGETLRCKDDIKVLQAWMGIWNRCAKLPAMPTSRIRAPGFGSWLNTQLQLPANVHPGRQQTMIQILESLPPNRETQIEFPSVGFSLLQTGLFQASGERISK